MRIRNIVGIALIISMSCCVAPNAIAAEDASLVGVVTAQYGNQVVFKTSAAVTYRAEGSYARIVRRNGSALAIADISVGDRIEVRGQVWSDNSVSASFIRDISLYTHTGTFSGKIASLDVANKSFVLQGSQNITQHIHTTEGSMFFRNGQVVTFQDLSVGMSATVKGLWERSRVEVIATSVRASVRWLNIDITGEVTMKNGLALTVASNGVLYAVDASSGLYRTKNNKVLAVGELGLGRVRVWGKHIAESTAVVASRVKYLDITK